MNTERFQFPSATGVCPVHACVYTPESGQSDTVLVIHHGMSEHQKRYEPLIRFLCGQEISVYMHDMASHGESCADPALTGWFGEKDGWNALVEDFRTMILRARRENPGKKLIVMGHSMGSFVCRVYTARHPEDGVAGAIYMGTGGPNPAAGAGLAASAFIAALRGKKHKSKLMDTLAFGSYGKRFEGRTAFDWLTRDTKIVDQYIRDPLCGYLFTVQGMNDLIRVNIASNSPEWYQAVPSALPVLLISGELDPVGDYGRGVRTVAEELKRTGHTAVTLKLYPEDRHEVLNELNRDEVMNDILQWIRSV